MKPKKPGAASTAVASKHQGRDQHVFVRTSLHTNLLLIIPCTYTIARLKRELGRCTLPSPLDSLQRQVQLVPVSVPVGRGQRRGMHAPPPSAPLHLQRRCEARHLAAVPVCRS